MTKQVRIDASGKVVNADRTVHTTKNPANGGPDRVHFIVTPGNGGKFRVDFSAYLQGSPFEQISVSVPNDGAQEVTGNEGTYKYDVYDSGGKLTDDPNVIID